MDRYYCTRWPLVRGNVDSLLGLLQCSVGFFKGNSLHIGGDHKESTVVFEETIKSLSGEILFGVDTIHEASIEKNVGCVHCLLIRDLQLGLQETQELVTLEGIFIELASPFVRDCLPEFVPPIELHQVQELDGNVCCFGRA